MTDFLLLSRWEVLAVHEHDHGYRVDATYRDLPTCCVRCGSDDDLYRHGFVHQSVNDTTHSGKPVVIDLQRQRYKCQACGGTFVQPVTDIDERHLMTTRLVQHIERSALTRTHVATYVKSATQS